MISPNMFGSMPPTTNKALAATALRDASLDGDPTKSSSWKPGSEASPETPRVPA